MPIVACIGGVFDGDDPISASSNQTPRSMRLERNGQSSGHSSSTLRPAPSHTSVTSSFGGPARSLAGSSARVSSWPSGAAKSKSSISAFVGAMSASVARPSTRPSAGTRPGP